MNNDKILCFNDLKDNAGNLIFRKDEYYAYIYNKNNNKIVLYTHDEWELPLQLDLNENLQYLKKFFILPTNVKRINIVKTIIKKEFSDDYEAYMKLITDNFIEMQSDNIISTLGHDKMDAYKEVIWDGQGIDFELIVNPTSFIKGISLEDVKKYNSEIAQKYLAAHSLTYEQWCNKFKSNK